MNFFRLQRILLAVFGIFWGASLGALDFSAVAGAGNLSFDRESRAPMGAKEFSGHPYPLGRIGISGDFSDLFGFSVFFQRDPVLGNILEGILQLDTGYLSFSLGPLFSISNTRGTIFSPGITTGMRLGIPGIIFIEVKGMGNLGSFSEEGDYAIESSSAALGFWLPHLVNTLSVSVKKFGLLREMDLFTGDQVWRFCYRGEIYAKNVPYTIFIDMGYQTLTRSYTDQGLETSDHIRSIFLGFEASVKVRPLFALVFGAEIPLYTWGKEPLVRSSGAWFIQGFAGFVWSFEANSS
ncbi:MAG: hypothetical protein LBE02_00435 [Spirochaetaceae bacterium]|jgi:hypothetical protein|nr:hypothetical protein [Spirochaetaceae bacterium]